MQADFSSLPKVDHLLGLIGYPLSHSFSKGYFAKKFNQENIANYYYESFPIEHIEEFPKLWNKLPNLKGLNVTIPYKEKVIPFLDAVDETVSKIGATNTIKKLPDGRLVGFNTDVIGFERSVRQKAEASGIEMKKALILGTGGAAKAVYFVMEKLNIEYSIVSRNKKKGDLVYHEITGELIDNVELIVNTTPLGMSPNTDTFPSLPYEALCKKHLLYDLVYNPEKTLFLQKGEEMGAATINGLEMLHLQAEAAWNIWTQ